MELPSEPDPGSAGSSSCVQIISTPTSVRGTSVVLAESSNFATGSPHVRRNLGPLQAPEERRQGEQTTHLSAWVRALTLVRTAGYMYLIVACMFHAS